MFALRLELLISQDGKPQTRCYKDGAADKLATRYCRPGWWGPARRGCWYSLWWSSGPPPHSLEETTPTAARPISARTTTGLRKPAAPPARTGSAAPSLGQTTVLTSQASAPTTMAGGKKGPKRSSLPHEDVVLFKLLSGSAVPSRRQEASIATEAATTTIMAGDIQGTTTTTTADLVTTPATAGRAAAVSETASVPAPSSVVTCTVAISAHSLNILGEYSDFFIYSLLWKQ